MLLKLHFDVLFRRVLFVMSIVYYIGDQKRVIPRAMLLLAINIILKCINMSSRDGGTWWMVGAGT